VAVVAVDVVVRAVGPLPRALLRLTLGIADTF
jgi:hypothetical protein